MLKVGIDLMKLSIDVSEFVSQLTLANTTWFLYFFASFLKVGAICMQGPGDVAS
jgi:hypothetical protein